MDRDGVINRIEDLVAGVCADGPAEELLAVARAWPDLMRPYHRRLIDADVTWPEDLYRGMDELTAAYLVELIDGGQHRPDQLLGLLAVGQTQIAVAAVDRWRTEPPAWASALHWPIGRYGHVGGWEFDEDGGVRSLTCQAAFQLGPATDAAAPISGGSLSAQCGWCDLPLWRMLDIDLADPALADLGMADAGRVVVGGCIRCSCYTTLFTVYRGDRSLQWCEENERPDFLGYDGDTWLMPPDEGLAVVARRPTPYAGDAWSAGGSTLGGTPDWIQDPDYPTCPRCHQTMRYLGMITGDDLWRERAEGCHYLFIDPACHTSTTVYQQT